MNVVIDEPYPEMFSTVEKKVFDKILAFVLITYPVTFCLQSFHSCFFFRTQKRTEPNHRTENVTYEYTVTPKSHGPTTVPRTHITYDDSNEAHIDADLRLLVESPEEYAKRTDRHIVCFLPHLNSHPQRDLTIERYCFFLSACVWEQIDWIVYLAASVLAAGIPSFVFYKKDKAFK